MYAEKVDPEQDNDMYGKGSTMKRYTAMPDVLDVNEGAVDRTAAWEALKAAAQEPNTDDITGNTQRSIMFDNTNTTAEFSLRRRWERVLHLKLTTERFFRFRIHFFRSIS